MTAPREENAQRRRCQQSGVFLDSHDDMARQPALNPDFAAVACTRWAWGMEMHKTFGVGVAACAIAFAVPAADGAASAASAARGELIVNFNFTENYTRNFQHNDEHAATTENMSFHGTVKRPYAVTISNGQLVDVEEMSPDEAKKNTAQPSGGGSLQYNATETTSGSGFTMTAKKSYTGSFGNDSVSATLIPGEDGVMTLRSELHATHISGSCSLQSKNANSNDCTAVPLSSMGPSIDADGAQSARFDWSQDVATGDEPKGTIHSADQMVTYLLGIPGFGLQQTANSGGNRAYTFHKTVQFRKRMRPPAHAPRRRRWTSRPCSRCRKSNAF